MGGGARVRVTDGERLTLVPRPIAFCCLSQVPSGDPIMHVDCPSRPETQSCVLHAAPAAVIIVVVGGGGGGGGIGGMVMVVVVVEVVACLLACLTSWE